MIRLQLPTGFPDPDHATGLEFRTLEIPFNKGWTLFDYLEHYDLNRVTQRVVYKGKSLYPNLKVERKKQRKVASFRFAIGSEWIEETKLYVLSDGDELHVIPVVTGKNAGIIGGVVGAVAGIAILWATGGTGAMQAMAVMQAASTGFAVGATIGSLFIPRPKTNKGDGNISRYQWSGIQNEDRPGAVLPVCYGIHPVNPIRISYLVRRGTGLLNATTSELRLLVCCGQGEVEGFNMVQKVGRTNPRTGTDMWEDVRINGQHFTDFPGISIDYRLGTPSQTVMAGFETIGNTIARGVEIGQMVVSNYTAAPDLFTLPPSAGQVLDSFEVLLSFAGLSHTKSDGSLRENKVRYLVQYRLLGSSTWINAKNNVAGDATTYFEATGANRSTFPQVVRVEGLTPGRYEVRSQWVSADHTNEEKGDLFRLYITDMTYERNEARSYPNRVLLGIKGIATEKLSGVPQVEAVLKGRKLSWHDGTALQAETFQQVGEPYTVGRSAAWQVVDMLRNVRYGAGRWLPDSLINFASFKAFDDYNREIRTVELVDGTTYTEPRNYSDFVIDQKVNIIDLANDILASNRATLVFVNGKIEVSIDRDETPRQLFTMGNIVKGTLNIDYRSEQKNNTYDIDIASAANNWQSSPFPVTLPEAKAAGEVIRRASMSMYGTTRDSQAAREGIYRLRKDRFLRRVVSFGASTDSIMFKAGQLFNLSHELPAWGVSGRLMPYSTANLLILDTELEISRPSGETWQVMVRFADDTTEIRTIVDDDGVYNEIHVDAPFSQTPQEGDLFAAGISNILVKPFRCLSITKDTAIRRRVIGLEHNADIVNDEDVIDIPSYTTLPNAGGPPPPILDLVAYEEVIEQRGSRYISNIFLHWSKAKPQRGYGLHERTLVERSWNGTNWEVLGETSGLEWVIREAPTSDVPDGVTIYFRVTPISRRGIYNTDGADTATVTTKGKQTLPLAVVNFAATVRDNSFIWTWNELQDATEYEIRSGNDGWGTREYIRGNVTAYTAPTEKVGSITINGTTFAIAEDHPLTGVAVGSAFILYYVKNDRDELIYPSKVVADVGQAAASLTWRGRGSRFILTSPNARTLTQHIKAVDAHGNLSFAAVNATASDAAPAVPTIASISKYRNAFKVKVTPPVDTDVVALHLWASTNASDLTTLTNTYKVAQVVSAAGGEFIVQVPPTNLPTTTWYFKAAAEDWLTQRLGDWNPTAAQTATLNYIVAVAPSLVPNPPNGLFLEVPTEQTRQRGFRTVDGDPTDFEPVTRKRSRVVWTHTDSGSNPSGYLIGFQVAIIPYSTDPDEIADSLDSPMLDSGIIAGPLKRTFMFPPWDRDDEPNVMAAVRAVYIDNVTSAWATSNGLIVAEDVDLPLSILVQDAMGNLELPDSADDHFPMVRDLFGVRGTKPLDALTNPAMGGIGVLLESGIIGNQYLEADLLASPWNPNVYGTGTATATIALDNSELPPEPGDWRVYRLTKTGAVAYMNLFRMLTGMGALANRNFNASFWVKNVGSAAVDAYSYLFAPTSGITSNHSTVADRTIAPGSWARVQTASGSWSAADSSTSIAPVLRVDGAITGESILVAVPQFIESSFAHAPLQLGKTRANTYVAYPPLGAAGKNWTVMFRMSPIYQAPANAERTLMSIERSSGTTKAIELTLTNRTDLKLKTTAPVGGAVTTSTVVISDAAHTFAIRRSGLVFHVFVDSQLVITHNAPADPTSVPVTRLFLGYSGGTANMSVRGLTIFKDDLIDSDIKGIAAQGLRFIYDKPKKAVPRVDTVTVLEV